MRDCTTLVEAIITRSGRWWDTIFAEIIVRAFTIQIESDVLFA